MEQLSSPERYTKDALMIKTFFGTILFCGVLTTCTLLLSSKTLFFLGETFFHIFEKTFGITDVKDLVLVFRVAFAQSVVIFSFLWVGFFSSELDPSMNKKQLRIASLAYWLRLNSPFMRLLIAIVAGMILPITVILVITFVVITHCVIGISKLLKLFWAMLSG